MSELSKPYADLLRTCATCGGPMPCALHDAQLREAILHPPERAELPWDRVERREVTQFGYDISALHALPGGGLLVGRWDGVVVQVDPAQPAGSREIASWQLSDATVIAIRARSDGSFFACAGDGSVWRFSPGPDAGYARMPVDSIRGVYAFRLFDDNVVAMGQLGGNIWRVDFASPRGVRMDLELLAEYNSAPCDFLLLPDGSLLIVDELRRFVRFDPQAPEGHREEVLATFDHKIRAMTTLPDGTCLLGGVDGRIFWCDPQRSGGERIQEIGNYGEAIYAMDPTSDHSFLVGGAHGAIAEFSIPEQALREYRERKLEGPVVPPMPEA